MNNFEANGTTRSIQRNGRLDQMEKQTNTDHASLQDQVKLDTGGQTSVRWFDKVKTLNQTKSEDSSRYKVGLDRGEILQKWEEMTGQEKHLGNKEEMTKKQEEDEERLKEDKLWKSELMMMEEEKSIHSWEMINNLRESLEKQKGTRQKNEVESENFQRTPVPIENHRAPQGVKRDYVLI